jgi:thiol-disulfide isomerase/thioredoxin
MTRLLALSLAAFAALATTAPAQAAQAPKLAITSFDQLAQPLPLPYDEKADAKAAVAAAKARARANRKLLLIDLGGNWCLDCRVLAGTIEQPALKSWLAKKYEIVTVDVGRFDKNLDVPAHYGITERLKGVPSVLVVNPKTDKLINPGKTAALSDARHMNPQGLADWLAQWTR